MLRWKSLTAYLAIVHSRTANLQEQACLGCSCGRCSHGTAVEIPHHTMFRHHSPERCLCGPSCSWWHSSSAIWEPSYGPLGLCQPSDVGSKMMTSCRFGEHWWFEGLQSSRIRLLLVDQLKSLQMHLHQYCWKRIEGQCCFAGSISQPRRGLQVLPEVE